MIDGYTNVTVVVSNRRRAKKWYTEKLGFRVVFDLGHTVAVSPDSKERGLVLHLCGDHFAPLEPGNTGIGFRADDFDETCRELKRNGVQFSLKPTKKSEYKVARFLDLDRNEFWLFDGASAEKLERMQEARTRAAGRRPVGTKN
jgi:catechol 2,3-dioxygenase-like lactoylglutathione lyase family enzyme